MPRNSAQPDLACTAGADQVGIPGFEIVHGGLPRGRSTLVAGATGTGKTVFGLQFLWGGAHLEEPGVLVTFAERPAERQTSG